MKINEIVNEGFWAGIARGLTPQAIKNIPDLPDRGTQFATDEEYCRQAAAKFGFPPDECGGPTVSQQPARTRGPLPSTRVQQVEIAGTTLTRAPGGDWYEMTTNTLVTDPNIIARANKRWDIQQQNLQMAPGYQPMVPSPGRSGVKGFSRTPGGRRGRK